MVIRGKTVEERRDARREGRRHVDVAVGELDTVMAARAGATAVELDGGLWRGFSAATSG